MNGAMRRLAGRRRTQAATLLGAALGLAVLLNAMDVNLVASQTVTLKSVPVAEDPGLDPEAAAWSQAQPIDVPLTGQLVAYPMGGGSTPSVTVRALNTPDKLYIRVDWADDTRDDRMGALTDLTDAVAVEFPTLASVSTPSICMGQAGAAVNIWQWRAVLQGEGLPSYRESRVNMYTDDDQWARVEPDQPDLAYPARQVGNPVSGVLGGPVLDLTAQAFGTLAPTAEQLAAGRGVWRDGQWSVVFQRDLKVEADDEAALGGGVETDMAVAVWNGSLGERSGQKSVSQFFKLSIPASMVVPGRVTAGDLLMTFGIPALAILAAAAVLRWMIIGKR